MKICAMVNRAKKEIACIRYHFIISWPKGSSMSEVPRSG